jgi:fumarate reductase subunit C
MFYVIDNHLITICQRLIWHIERSTPWERSDVAKLITVVHKVFMAVLLFFGIASVAEGSMEASLFATFILVPLFSLHLYKLEKIKRMKLAKDPSLTGELWRKPPSVERYREERQGIFVFSALFALFFMYIFSLSKTNLDSLIFFISTVIILSPWVAFLSEYFFCTVSLPPHAREWKEKERNKKDDDVQ